MANDSDSNDDIPKEEEEEEEEEDKKDKQKKKEKSLEEIQRRHKKDVRSLEDKRRSALKKVKNTSGKKKAKEAIAAVEREYDEKMAKLLKKHGKEMKKKTGGTKDSDDKRKKSSCSETEPTSEEQQHQLKEEQVQKEEEEEMKKQRKIEKARQKRLKQRQSKQEFERRLENNDTVVDSYQDREEENDQMRKTYLDGDNLTFVDIQADGNCLYRAIAHQMTFLDDDDEEFTFGEMRSKCAKVLLEHESEFAPFVDLDDTSISSYAEYVQRIKSSSEWGGHVEIRALAMALQRSILIYSADAPPLTVEGGGDANGSHKPIRLSFHRRYYALGEHYNSVVPKEDV